jgi:hypothetical protein
MDDFQLRVVRAAERLAGRDGPELGDRLASLQDRLDSLIAVLKDIRDRLPRRPGPP